jgi:hypothetical protein
MVCLKNICINTLHKGDNDDNNNNNNNNNSDWELFKIIQKMHKQHTRKPLSEGTTENSHIGHCTHTSESANLKVQ